MPESGRLAVPSPVSGGLVLSYRCSAECSHCIYACSPRWKDPWIEEETLARMLDQLAGRIQPGAYGRDSIDLNMGLHFTGGEPFLNFDLLCRAVEMAHQREIPSLFAETNCVWCNHDEDTRDKLRMLQSRGMRGLMISVNPFYLEYVPFERTRRGVQIAHEIFGVNLIVYQVGYFHLFQKLGISGTLSPGEFLELTGKHFYENAEFFFSGRSVYRLADSLKDSFPLFSGDRLASQPCQPAFVRPWHNHFDNEGYFMPGYCGGIRYGDCRNLAMLLEEGIDPGEKPVLAFLMLDDFAGLIRFVEKEGYEIRPGGYFSKCHLCIDIRRHLARTGSYPELAPMGFYQHLD